MKRDMELVRTILIEMEKWPLTGGELRIPGRSDEEITYHVGLMVGAGLITAINVSSADGPGWLPEQLTWEGHEFLAAAQSDTVWNKAKDHVIRTTGTLTLEGLKTALAFVVQKAVTGGM